MLKNLIKVSLRSLLRYKGAALINVFGLTAGMVSCLIIFVFIHFELNYDRHHENSDQLFRVTYDISEPDGQEQYTVTPNALVEAIKEQVVGIEAVSQLQLSYGQSSVRVEDQSFEQLGVIFVDPVYFDLFSYDFVEGSAEGHQHPNTVVLTESLARKYFGNSEALGASIKLNDRFDLTVSGVISDPPTNSHLPFTFLVSHSTLKRSFGEWNFSDGNVTYIALAPGISPQQIENNLTNLLHQNQALEYQQKTSLHLQAVSSIHTDTRYSAYPGSFTIHPIYLWSLACIGLLILLSASINYINMTASQGILRAREVGIRKSLGSSKLQLVTRFMGETIALLSLTAIGSLGIAGLVLPELKHLLGIQIPISSLFSPQIHVFLILGVGITGILAGLYPALFISSYHPIRALKGAVSTATRSSMRYRNALIVCQLVVTQAILLGVLVVFNQVRYIGDKDLGFEDQGRVIVQLPEEATNRDVFKARLTQDARVNNLAYAMGGPTKNGTLNSEIDHEDTNLGEIRTIPIDAAYLDVFDIPLVAGENLSDHHEILPTSRVALINEAMVTKLGFQYQSEALGARLTSDDFVVEVIGVVQDFHQKSLRQQISPALMLYWPRWTDYAAIEFSAVDTPETLLFVEEVFKNLYPDSGFLYYFLDTYIQGLYEAENQLSAVLKIFALIAIIIGSLGLYGLVSIVAEQRKKEIGIRKSLGASVLAMLNLLVKDYLTLTLMALIIAVPVGGMVMHQWLQSFAYRVSIDGTLILTTIGISILITLIAVSYKALKAASVNPVDCLKYH